MKSIEILVETFLDNRDALSTEEMSRLARELDRSPRLAEAVKDQLVVRELLSQRLAEDRRNFPAQVAQRRRDFGRGEEELFRQVMDVRSLAAEELDRSHRRRFRQAPFWAGLAGALVAAVVAGVSWDRFHPPPTVARLVETDGEVLIERGQQRLAAITNGEIKTGDSLAIGTDASAKIGYPDGTTLLLDSEATVQLQGRPDEAKQVRLSNGGLSASVSPQPVERPLLVETDVATVRVLGTQFFVYATPEGMRVGVTEGRVALVRRSDGQEVEIGAGSSGFASNAVLEAWKGVWPSNATGAALVMESAPKLQSAVPATVAQLPPVTLVPQGRARISEHGSLVLDDGAFVAQGAGDAINHACRRTGEITVEAVVRPNDFQQQDATILTLAGEGDEAPNFALSQRGDRLVFFLRDADPKTADAGHLFDVVEISEDRPRHVALVCRPGRLACYVDGQLRYENRDVQIDFASWRPGELVFGDAPDGGQDWRGVLEGIAVYNRALCRNEIQRNAAAYETILEQRRPVSFSDRP